MQEQMTSLQFIKKSRPKLKQGDVFYYTINKKFYFGIVLLTKLHPHIKEGIEITILLPNYSEDSINEFKEDNFIEYICNRKLLAPQVVINKKSWLLGFFVNFKNICLSKINILDNLRFEDWGEIYNYKYQKENDIPELALFGNAGLYGYEGVEYLIQVGLGLFYDENERPYKYYKDDDFTRYIKNRTLPHWYNNSITKKQLKP